MAVIYAKVLTRHSPAGTKENNEYPASGEPVPAGIITEYLPNTSQKLYRLLLN
jgi:hypothetical protein